MRKNRTLIQCAECEADVAVRPCEHGRKKYCSKACLGIANGRRLTKWNVRELVAKIDTDECVDWPGPRSKRSGYGKATLDGVGMHAHTAALIVSKGSLAIGQMGCHTCDNPPCFNPRHIYAGTNQTNADDRVNRGRSARGERNGGCKLTAAQVLIIRQDSRKTADIASDYDVSLSAIKAIRRRHTWKHI